MPRKAGGLQSNSSGGRLVFYGRVRDQEGAGVPGALVIVFSDSGEGERPLGHGYSDRDGWYAVQLPRPGESGSGRYMVRAVAGACPPGDLAEGGYSWQGQAGLPDAGKILVECRVINYSQLGFNAEDGQREVSLEAVPETVCVDCAENKAFELKLISISGRGYISCGPESGEGSFTLTVCRFRDLPGRDLLRLRISPDEPSAALNLDTGGLPAGLY